MNSKIDFKKPIIAENSEGCKFLLLPQLKKNSGYITKGYNWLNLITMGWNSCCYFDSIEQAVKSYNSGYIIYNAQIKIAGEEN